MQQNKRSLNRCRKIMVNLLFFSSSVRYIIDNAQKHCQHQTDAQIDALLIEKMENGMVFIC